MAAEFLGIDGCRAGWLCISLRDNNKYQYKLAHTLDLLTALVNQAELALIDMPIGLVAPAQLERRCDKEARRVLGMPRAASVFSPPVRAALDADSYRQAFRINHQQAGKGISKQAWNIMPKIREVDTLLRRRREFKTKLRECHPEVCFWALNQKKSMAYNKRTIEGREERLSVLAKYLPQATVMVESIFGETLRRQVAWDDIVDALALALTARLGNSKLFTLPRDPCVDEYGLPMEIVYATGL